MNARPSDGKEDIYKTISRVTDNFWVKVNWVYKKKHIRCKFQLHVKETFYFEKWVMIVGKNGPCFGNPYNYIRVCLAHYNHYNTL